jgi:alpha-N-acetylglucosaminidase
MKEIIADFGTDHVWQMDGFFGNGTGWGGIEPQDCEEKENSLKSDTEGYAPTSTTALKTVACTWSEGENNTYIQGCAKNNIRVSPTHQPPIVGACTPTFATLDKAKAACASVDWLDCSGVTFQFGSYQLRTGRKFIKVPASDNEISYAITNLAECKVLPAPSPSPPSPAPPAIDPVWLARAQGAYGAVERADGPEARWILQGWMLLIKGTGFGPPAIGAKALSRLRAYAAAAPPGRFIVTDMSRTGTGQWKDWHGDWGLPFIWTALHVFGGNDGFKGNMSMTNAIPFDAPPLTPIQPWKELDPKTQAVGVGYTPEGLDQNPAYYEVLQEAAFKEKAEANVTEWLVKRAHRRYGLSDGIPGAATAVENPEVASAWANIGGSGYAHDGQVHDPTGVALLHPSMEESWTGFKKDKKTPTVGMCMEWKAWKSLLASAPAVKLANEATPTSQKFGDYPKTFTYDLVDIGREVLAQLTIPVAQNFSAALKGELNADRANRTGTRYGDLLRDLDSLLATDTAFMLGPWLASARKLAGDATDCTDTVVGDLKCDDFMEWNARCQVTTWKPTPKNGPIGEPEDYARKHWSGLVSDYYATRVDLFTKQALLDAAKGKPFNIEATKAQRVKLAYEWQTDFGNSYPTTPESDPVTVSTALTAKWGGFFGACD